MNFFFAICVAPQAHVTRQLVLGAALGWLPLAAADGVLPGLLLPAHRPQLAFLRDAGWPTPPYCTGSFGQW